MTDDIQFKVILDASHVTQTDAFCRSLTDMGLTVETSMPEIGVIFASGRAELLPRMQAMEGVIEAVAEGRMRALKPD